MIQANTENIISPVRKIISKVELFDSSTSTKSGGYISVNDVAPVRQELQGKIIGVTDFSNITVTKYGRNLLDASKFSFPTQTINGITFEKTADNIIHIYGQAIDSSTYTSCYCTYLPYEAKYRLPAGTYSANSIAIASGKRVYLQATMFREDTTYIKNINRNNILIEEEGYIGRFSIVVGANITEELDVYLPLQVSMSDTCLDYEEYKEEVYTVDVEGNIEGLTSYSPEMTLIPSVSGVTINLSYEALVKSNTFTYEDAIQEVSIERVGEDSKFFGFGVSQKAKIKLRDKDKVINPTTKNAFKIHFGTEEDNYIETYNPLFFVTETNRDEITGALSITTYDLLHKAEKHYTSELEQQYPYTIKEFAAAVATFLGLGLVIPEDNVAFYTSYAEGANIEGTESLKDMLTAIAEATQTIYYLTDKDIVFKSLDKDGAAVLTITKADYTELDSSTNRRLSTIFHTTQLGDNIGASTTTTGTTQYVRDNPFWELREDIESLVNEAVERIGGISINQFDCKWRGNFLLEIGDKIDLVTKDNKTVTSYVLNDVISYNGALSQSTKWEYQDKEEETASTPTTVGEALKYTYAKVDKINKEISMVASETSANSSAIAAIQINTDSISQSVTSLGEKIETQGEGFEERISLVENNALLKLTPQDITAEINETVKNKDNITTSTGFTFDKEGLTIQRKTKQLGADGEEIVELGKFSTTITENGMYVKDEGKEVLTANAEGVNAKNLHATTYLFIGQNSRFEDYKNGTRTGCFWIGG